MKRIRQNWDFPYEGLSPGPLLEEQAALDVVVATRDAVHAGALRAALGDLGPTLEIEPLLERAPLHWTRLRSAARVTRAEVTDALARASVRVRYVTSAVAGTMDLPPALDLSTAHSAQATDWPARQPRPAGDTPPCDGLWFLGAEGGVRVDRQVCGTGAGARLAVIDDDAADFERLELDRVERINVSRVPAAYGHAGLMVGWASGALRVDGTRFAGVAPDASVRAYCIPKAGTDVVSLPLAIARAVFDGADVIVCATYVEGTTSMMLDDALGVAAHLGRGGRGTVVVLPTGREASSPPGSVHASFSLSLGDPASDPRVSCIAPGGRRGGWFVWRSAQGKLRPFANRGPAVRWLAPGDDMAHPFSSGRRLFHAESSGASAIAAGVMSLVLACNPELRLPELHALLARTVDAADPDPMSDPSLADPADLLPIGADRDGHDAKRGYGRLNATRACAGARDPMALALVALGEDDAAVAWCARDDRLYSMELARWCVHVLLASPHLEHAARVIARHARLISGAPHRARAQAPGALARQLMLLGRELARSPGMPPCVAEELERGLDRLRAASRRTEPFGQNVDFAALQLLARAWNQGSEAGDRPAEAPAFGDHGLQA